MLQYGSELPDRLELSPLDSTGTCHTDSNNNSHDSDKSFVEAKSDKYSLRPRSARRKTLPEDSGDDLTTPSAPSSKSKGRSTKSKQKPEPLSKYRRKTANARERTRMKEINQAFETLRRAVPQMPIAAHPTNEKLTKITTLRLAMKYISALSSVLSNNSDSIVVGVQQSFHQHELMSDCYTELDSFLLESDGESLQLHSSDLSEPSLTPPDFAVDFPEDSLTPVEFAPLSPDLAHHLNSFDPFLLGFN